jgi:hypothetical protein
MNEDILDSFMASFKFFLMMIVIFVFILSFRFRNLALYDAMQPEVWGGASGVIIGFAFYEYMGTLKNINDRSRVRKYLRTELEESDTILEKDTLELLPTSNWSSLLSTGDLSLLKFDQRKEIAKVYSLIEKQNYETKRIHDYEIQFNSAIAGATGTLDATGGKARRYLVDLKEKHSERKIATVDSIKRLLSQNWIK